MQRSMLTMLMLYVATSSLPARGADAVPSKPLASRPSAGKAALFELLPAERTGVDLVIPIDTTHPLKQLYTEAFFCGGVAIGDLDGDDRPDLYLISGPGKNRLYRQVDDFRFEDITERAGVGDGDHWGVGAAMVDIDADGDLDIYLCNYNAVNRLFLNDGHATFHEAATGTGLDIVDSSLLPAFCDYDRDGDLDCYLLTNRYFHPGGLPKDLKLITRGGRVSLPPEYERYYSVRPTGRNRGELQLIGRPDRLLQNDGQGHFGDVTVLAGMQAMPDHGLSATWWDYNRDGNPDLYVCNDFNDPDHFYHNNGDGTFTDVVRERLPHTAWFAMGADAGDINNDGRPDLLVGDMSGTTHFSQKISMGAMGGKNAWFLEFARPLQYMRNAFFLNTGTDRFMEIAYMTGLDSTDWTWCVKFLDLDNDGLLDIYVTNGMTRNLNDSDLPFTIADEMGRTKWDLYESQPELKQRNLAFRNRGDLQFDNVGAAWGLDHLGISCAAAAGDLDRDGDLDLVVANLDEPVSIYRNQLHTGHAVLIKLQGSAANRAGVGASVQIQSKAGQQFRQQFPIAGYLASHDPVIHFGLGDSDTVDLMTIDWPSGNRQQFQGLEADRLYTITEQATSRTPAPQVTAAWFEPFDGLNDAVHTETPFDDFRRQPLLPNRHSQLGPGIACGDVDGDGDEDLYVGGAAGQSGRLFFNRGGGVFAPGDEFPFNQAAACEDMGAVMFDADGDHDLDLYVVSGGVECDPESVELSDRLYLNRAGGRFVVARDDVLPVDRDSGSTVSAADFDRDGDVDLFVGGRVVPGAYPLPARNRLLSNEQGRFAEVTLDRAPALQSTGLVTASLWTDVDHDGWLDLLVAHEWGPVKLFRNQQGQLVDQTVEAGLAELLGWWNSIAGRDLDSDGDMDYVVGNFGLNTKYHATADKPTLLFYGDVDRSGNMNLIEAEYEADKLFPVRGRSCSSNAMPSLREKYSSYKSFALAELTDIYEPTCLDSAHRFAANTLASGVLLNDGSGKFQFQSLPRLVQASPVFGLALTELDGDGHCDLYVVQNFFSPQVETGRMDGGLSLLLRGRGDGTFEPVDPALSGLIVPGDGKSLVTTDLDGDQCPDLVVGMNNDVPRAFLNRTPNSERIHTVRLRGPAGNPTALGARVTLLTSDGSQQTAEVYGGGGYLSQCSAVLSFGVATGATVERVDVTWPDGSISSVSAPQGRAIVMER